MKIELDKQTNELIIKGKTEFVGLYEYFFDNGKIIRKLNNHER